MNFILCDDNEFVLEQNKNIINKTLMKYDINYNIHNFTSYDSNFNKIINSSLENKIYILDLELPKESGLEIARKIRKDDWNSIIIILTSHDEYELKIFKEKLLIFSFISKFDRYEELLSESIDLIVNKINSNNKVSFISNKERHYLNPIDIIYFYKDTIQNCTIVVTKEDKYPVRESIYKFKEKLDDSFIQTHRSCYINKNNIKKVDYKNKLIVMKEDIIVDYLSKNYIKNVRSL